MVIIASVVAWYNGYDCDRGYSQQKMIPLVLYYFQSFFFRIFPKHPEAVEIRLSSAKQMQAIKI